MRKILIIAVLGFFIGTGFAFAQTDQERIQELQAQINALEQEAAKYRGNIASEQAKADTLNREIAILKNQISQIETQIYITNKKIDRTQITIEDTQERIADTQDHILKEQETVSTLMLFLQQQDRLDLVANLLKYNDLGQFFGQLNQVANVNTQLLAAIDDLRGAKTALESDKTDLQSQQNDLEQLNQASQAQRNALSGTKSYQEKLLKDTKGQEALYQQQLNDVVAKESAFFQEMEQLEGQVIAGGLYIVHVTAAPTPKANKSMFILPEANPRLTQGYGCTSYARCGSKRGPYGGAPHNGIDYASGLGTPIRAIGAGTILAHGTNDGWGNWVAIQHPNNMVSLYGHMTSFAPLPVGSAVVQGQTIGYEGRTGAATGPHVHLSLYTDFFTYIKPSNGQLYFNYFEGTVNPLSYMQ